ncbi:MAG: hypothetical protein ACO3HG_08310 [Schleiferiaceae bacterium]
MDRVAQWILGTEAVLAILALLAVLVLAIRRVRMRNKEEFEHRDN